MSISGLVAKIESIEITFPKFLGVILALIIIRAFLESFSSTIFDIPNYTAPFLIAPLFYFSSILAFVTIIAIFTRGIAKKFLPISLFGFLLVFVPPLIDFFSTKKSLVPALIVGSSEIGTKFFTFLFDTSSLSLTWGAKAQLILLVLAVAIFVAAKTKKIWPALGAGLVAYAVFFTLAAIMSIASIIIIRVQQGGGIVDALDILNLLTNSRGSLLVSYADPTVYASFFSASVFLPLIFLQLIILYLLLAWQKFRALLTAIRPTRLLTQFFIFGTGAVFAYTRLHRTDIFTPQFILAIVTAVITVLFAWLFSVFLNDIADLDIDRLTNPRRPLPSGIINAPEMRALAIIAALVTALGAFTLGYKMLVLFLVIIAIGYLYSTPPLRLKKWLFVSNVAMGATSALLFAAGYLLFNENNTIVNLPFAVSLLVFCVMTLLASAKDLKDYAGDLAGKAHTVLTVWGQKRGKLIVALMAFAAIMLFPIILHSADLLFVSLAFGLAAIFVILDRRVREIWLFGLMFVYVILVYLIAF